MEYGRTVAPKDAERHNGLAWSFEFKGVNITNENDQCYIIPTLEGNYIFTPNDVLIVGVKGELYPCKKDIFEITYDIEKEDSFIERLKKEYYDLQDKTVKLAEFLFQNGIAEKIGDYQYELLNIQHVTMIAYQKILNLRIKELLNETENSKFNS